MKTMTSSLSDLMGQYEIMLASNKSRISNE